MENPFKKYKLTQDAYPILDGSVYKENKTGYVVTNSKWTTIPAGTIVYGDEFEKNGWQMLLINNPFYGQEGHEAADIETLEIELNKCEKQPLPIALIISVALLLSAAVYAIVHKLRA